MDLLDRDEWRALISMTQGGETQATARPRRFTDTDRFAGFLRKILNGVEGDILLEVRQDDFELKLENLHSADDVAAAVAKLPRTSDSILSVWGRHRGGPTGGDPHAFHINFAPEMPLYPTDGSGPMVVAVNDAADPVRSTYELTLAVDAYTVPMTRRQRRQRTPFIRPLTSSDVEQQEHESQLAARAARVGIWAGAVSGLLGGVGGAIVVEIFKG